MKEDRYMAIPPGAIIPGSMPKFKIYVVSPEGHYILWALEGHKVTTAQLNKLAESRSKEVFIHLEEEFKYDEYLEGQLGNILENQAPTDDQKAAIFSKVSTNVVKDAFEKSFGLGRMTAEAIQRTELMVKNALTFIKKSGSLQALAKMIGHDYQTYAHATKVLWFVVAFLRDNPFIFERINPNYPSLDEEQRTDMLKQCGVGALLHDIGKALVPPEILNKIDPLNAIEWEILKRHPLNGLAMLHDTDIPGFVKTAILHHHEDFNGAGYPLGLNGVNISILGRVFRIIDVFDAMTSRRPYKEPVPPAKAAQIMVAMPGEKKTDGAIPGPEDRDQGMRKCFDEELLRKFIVFLGHARLSG
jgi:HD-GYP domain-containing protein (c-di-GMP phosphodiesterase class II)